MGVKLLILGFDGMDYFLTRETIKEYHFENIKPILRKQTVRNTLSGPSWTSFYTGLPVELHGVTNQWGLPEKESNTFKDIESHTFFHILKKRGVRTSLYNLPLTPEGFPHTSSAKKDIANRKGIKSNKPCIRNLLEEIEQNYQQVIKKQNSKNADLIFTQFSFPDRIGHLYTYRSKEITDGVYKLIYDIIDRFNETFQPEYFMTVSDHGFWRNRVHHLHANCAVLLTDKNTEELIRKNKLCKNFKFSEVLSPSYLFNNFRTLPGLIYSLIKGLHPEEYLSYFIHRNYILQTDIFTAILKIFAVNYEKTDRKIKSVGSERLKEKEKAEVINRLKTLGYI